MHVLPTSAAYTHRGKDDQERHDNATRRKESAADGTGGWHSLPIFASMDFLPHSIRPRDLPNVKSDPIIIGPRGQILDPVEPCCNYGVALPGYTGRSAERASSIHAPPKAAQKNRPTYRSAQRCVSANRAALAATGGPQGITHCRSSINPDIKQKLFGASSHSCI